MKLLSAPLNICLGITRECNLRCKHCYVSDTRYDKELTTEEFLNVIKQIKQIKVFDVDLFGGEPLMRKDFFVLLEALTRFKIGICLNTNGTLITEEIAKKLSQYHIRSVVVSLDGASGEIQDPLRGKGSFEKALKGIENLTAAKCRVFTATTVTRFNYRDLENIILLSQKSGVKGVAFNKLIHMGKAASDPALIMTPSERRELLAAVTDLKSKYPEFVSGSLLDVCQRMKNLHRTPRENFPLKVNTCLGGTAKCAIRPDGWVTPCEILWDVKAGHLREQSLRDIWHHSPVLQEFRKPLSVREDEIPDCKGCEHLTGCYRSSRCLPHFYPGKFQRKEFYCWK